MSLLVSDSEASRLQRGFKTWAENTAVSVRKRLGLRDTDPLPCNLLADHLGVRLWRLADVPGLPPDSLRHLSSAKGDEWSAVSVQVGQIDVVVVNPRHSDARQASDTMHELSHIIRNHEPAQVFVQESTGISMRSFNAAQESEANWLAGCLLLPRTALMHCAVKSISAQSASGLYGVSNDLYTYRRNITGVTRQFQTWRRTAQRE